MNKRQYIEKHNKQISISVKKQEDGTFYVSNNAVPLHLRINNDINELFNISNVLYKQYNDGKYDGVYIKFTMDIGYEKKSDVL